MFRLPILLSPMRQLCELLLLHCYELFFSLPSINRVNMGNVPVSILPLLGLELCSGRSRTAGAPRGLGGRVGFSVLVCRSVEAESMVWDKS